MRFITYKREKDNYSTSSAFASFALLRLLFTSNSVVTVLLTGRRKNISCSRTQGIVATPLQVGARASARRPWVRINTLFQPFKNVLLAEI